MLDDDGGIQEEELVTNDDDDDGIEEDNISEVDGTKTDEASIREDTEVNSVTGVVSD